MTLLGRAREDARINFDEARRLLGWPSYDDRLQSLEQQAIGEKEDARWE